MSEAEQNNIVQIDRPVFLRPEFKPNDDFNKAFGRFLFSPDSKFHLNHMIGMSSQEYKTAEAKKNIEQLKRQIGEVAVDQIFLVKEILGIRSYRSPVGNEKASLVFALEDESQQRLEEMSRVLMRDEGYPDDFRPAIETPLPETEDGDLSIIKIKLSHPVFQPRGDLGGFTFDSLKAEPSQKMLRIND